MEAGGGRAPPRRQRACVVGAGVVGLSTAMELLLRGWDVVVEASASSPNTVSDVAGGLWRPYAMSDPRAERWSAATFERLRELLPLPEWGVGWTAGYELGSGAPDPDGTFWHARTPGYRDVPLGELEALGLPRRPGSAWFTTLVVDARAHLAALEADVRARGARFAPPRRLESLEELDGGAGFDVIVLCAGLGAGRLAGDAAVQPGRGALVRVHAPQVKGFLVDLATERGACDAMLYIIPSSRADGSVALGGCNVRGDWREGPLGREEADAIVARCAQLVPALARAPVLAATAGLRPYREGGVRLELERRSQGRAPVVHNYGHSGSGWTLFAGCASDAADLCDSVINAGRVSRL